MSACRKEPKKILAAATEQDVSQVKFYYVMPKPYAESIGLYHNSTCAHYYIDKGGWEMPKLKLT